jgi:hypothetical protein
MIGKILSRILYYRYPQYVWAQRIKTLVKEFVDTDHLTFLDVPAGDGVISFWLSKSYANNPFVLCDIDHSKMQRAGRYLRGKNVTVHEANVFELAVGNSNVWLLINSLYLIDEIDLLFSRLAPLCPYVVVVCPRVDHVNYKSFMGKHPSFINHHELSIDETIAFFGKYGYALMHQEDLINIPFHRYSDNVAAKAVLGILFNGLDRFANRNDPAYWLAIFRREARATPASVIGPAATRP